MFPRTFSGPAGRAFVRAAASCLFAASVAVPWVAWAAPAEVSLDEAVRRAVGRAPMLEARHAEVDAAQQLSHRAGALPDPMLSVGIDNLPVTGADAFDTRVDDMTTKKIGLRQDIPARAKREAQRSLAARQIDVAQAQSLAEDLSVRRATAEAWIDAWRTRQEVAMLQALREQAALAAKLAKARLSGGSGSASDALAAQAAVLELDNRLEAARAGQAVAQAGLARWLGEETEPGANTPDFGTLPVPESQLLASVDRLGALRPVDAQVESAAAAIDAARAEKRPDWSVGASYGQRSDGRSDMLMFEVAVGLPLFTRNRQDRDVAAREAEYQATLATREDRRRQQAAQLRSDIARWQGLKRQVALHEDSLLPLARDRSSTALAIYRGGGELQPWLEARRDELDAHLLHIEHLNDLGRAWAALAYLLPTEAQP